MAKTLRLSLPGTTGVAVPGVAVVGAGIVLSGGIALAFWSTLGSGNGSASVSTDAGVTVTQDGSVSGLVPGGPAKPIDFTVTNDSATAATQIRTVSIGTGSFPAGCSSADFTVTQPSKPSVGTPLSVPAGGSLSFTSAGSGATGGTGAAIAMVNSSSNQDACKLATFTLTFSVS